jgi:hypothetical protein
MERCVKTVKTIRNHTTGSRRRDAAGDNLTKQCGAPGGAEWRNLSRDWQWDYPRKQEEIGAFRPSRVGAISQGA